MKNFRFYIKLLIALVLVLALITGCSKTNTFKPNGKPGDTAAEKSEEPNVVIDPQADFISGAKKLLSTDLVALLTEKEDGTPLVGMLSDYLYDLNNTTAQTSMKLTLSDVTVGEETLEENPYLSLDALHDSKTGDTSLELALGLGTENAKKAGIYLTGKSAVLKPGSTEEKILLYTMPDVTNATNTFLDKASILLTGLLSDDGKVYTFGSNLADRQVLCSRYLDPWLTDTKQDDYTDAQITKTLIGKEIPLRAVTLNMTGQRAYDFVLGNLQKLQADAQFADTDKLLGGIMGLFSSDILGLVQSLIDQSEGSLEEVTSAIGKLVTELKALTPEEISAAKFIVTISFDGDKPIGINIEASTTDKAFKLGAILYRSGLEHQLNLFYQYLDGTTASMTMSTVNTGGDNYDVSGKLSVTNSTGLEVLKGGYTGKLVETAAKYDLSGNINLNIQFVDSDGITQSGALGGDVILGITHDSAGYVGMGNMSISVKTQSQEESGLSAKIALDAKMTLPESVTIKPPMYTSSNSVTVTGRQELLSIHKDDLEGLSGQSKILQDIVMMLAFVIK